MATAWRTRSAERVRSGMRAVRLYGPRRLQTDDLPVPEPGVGEALVRVRAVGLCGSDLHYYCAGRIGLDAAQAALRERLGQADSAQSNQQVHDLDELVQVARQDGVLGHAQADHDQAHDERQSWQAEARSSPRGER